MSRIARLVSNPWPEHDRVVLFDGVCNFCNAVVDFIIRHDPDGRFAFAPLQSEPAQRLLEELGFDPQKIETFLYLEHGQVFTKSTAALKIAKALPGWSWLSVLAVVPRPVRDAVYNGLVACRYRLMGKRETCRVPSPDERHRFLC